MCQAPRQQRISFSEQRTLQVRGSLHFAPWHSRCGRAPAEEAKWMMRMLVVDDAPAWRALYRMAFDTHFEIFEASDGQQGLEVLDAVDPDVIVLDLRMPRMDGLDFIRRLGSRGVRGSIVVCSGALNEDERPTLPGIQLAP